MPDALPLFEVLGVTGGGLGLFVITRVFSRIDALEKECHARDEVVHKRIDRILERLNK